MMTNLLDLLLLEIEEYASCRLPKPLTDHDVGDRVFIVHGQSQLARVVVTVLINGARPTGRGDGVVLSILLNQRRNVTAKSW